MNIEKILTWIKDNRIAILIGVGLGLVLGLIIGWGIWPVQWTDLAPYHLRPDLREDYLRMAIHTSTTTGEASVASKAWTELADTAEETLDAVRNQPAYLSQQQIASFEAFMGVETAETIPTEEEAAPVEEEAAPVEEEVENGGPNWLLLGGLCIILFLIAAVVFYFLVLRNHPSDEGQPQPLNATGYPGSGYVVEDETPYAPETHEVAEVQPEEPVMPVAQFMSTYMIGDDLYDDSYSIDAPTGEFLGECGVGISETVGVGEPKRVTAFEVWLFDKNDIQTVTKVIMSAHAHADDKIRLRLESKGEPILAETGKSILLETASLQLEARIIDMEYGEGAAPDQSFFDRMTLELSAWPKK